MRIYMLNPPFLPNFERFSRWQGGVAPSGSFYYPIWLACATGVLEERFKEVKLVDAPAWKWDKNDVIQDAKKFKPDMAVIDSNFSSLSNDINVAKLLKDNVEGITTVLVGPPTSQFADRILESSEVDTVARFEYDFTLRDIAEALEEGKDFKDIKGISYKNEGKIIHNPNRVFISSEDLDTMPFVSRVYKKYLNIRHYRLTHALYPEVQILTSRGCPYQCTFCSWPETLMGRKYRSRSAENIADEFEYIQNELPEVKEVFIEDDTFSVSKKRVRKFCEEIQRRKINAIWSVQIRADVDYNTLKIMKEAGCRLVDVGYESGNDEILRNVKKGVNTDQMRRFTKDTKKAGLLILGDFVCGLPGETKDTFERTIKFAKELKLNLAQFSIATPIPGTKFYEQVKENGFLLVDDLEKSLDEKGFQKCIISYPQFTDKDIQKYADKAVREYYLRFSYVPIAFNTILRRNGLYELKTMMRSAKSLLKKLTRKR